MNLIIEIFILLLALSLTDFMLPRQYHLHKIFYKISFFLTYFLFTIKYYYGGDIALYVPFYDNIDNIFTLIRKGVPTDDYFEPGFWIFCSILKTLGCSFWMMSAIISTMYFYIIYRVFNKIKSYKIFALFILVILDYNLIFAEYRQCLAVCFFILMVQSCLKRKYIGALFFLILTAITHKSGAMVAVVTLIIMNFKYLHLSKRTYLLLIAVLFLFCFIPLRDVFLFMVNQMHLPESTYASIQHHFLLGRRVQTILLIYLFVIFTISFCYKDTDDSRQRKFRWVIFVSVIFVVFLYQYYYILNRLRSYFIPFIIVYMFNLLQSDDSLIAHKNQRLYSSIFVIAVYLFCINSIFAHYKEQNMLKCRIYDTCTIFDRLKYGKEEIKTRQMKKASDYWAHEFMKYDQNKIE